MRQRDPCATAIVILMLADELEDNGAKAQKTTNVVAQGSGKADSVGQSDIPPNFYSSSSGHWTASELTAGCASTMRIVFPSSVAGPQYYRLAGTTAHDRVSPRV